MKKFLRFSSIYILGILLFFTRTNISFAATFYSNDLTNNINGWTPIDGTYSSPTFSSSGMTNLQIPYSYSSLNFQGQRACIAADINVGTNSRMGIGFADRTFSGYDLVAFYNSINKLFITIYGEGYDIVLGSVGLDTGVPSPTDGAFHNYKLCEDNGSSYTWHLYLDGSQVYSHTFSSGSGLDGLTYPMLFSDPTWTYHTAIMKNLIVTSTTIQDRITYYTINNGTSFIRSTTPFITGLETQTANSDGSVTVSINNTTGYADSGFALYEGTLGNLPNFTVNGTGNQFGLNLWFDKNNDNEYFTWLANVFTGVGSDTYGLGPTSSSGTDAITGSSQFYLMSDGQNHTLSDLKNGNVSGISSSTKVAVWIGVNVGSGSTSATINSIQGL